jgi:hypothetical protein
MLRRQQRAAAGAGAIVRVLSAMAADAIDDRCATVNPFKGVRLRAGDLRVAKPTRDTCIWTMDQMHDFAAAAGPGNEPMIRMLADCGMRVGELLALRRARQDLKTGIFRVKGTAWNGAVIETSREKNHDREGPIPPGTLALLRATPARIDVEWLFFTPGGRPICSPPAPTPTTWRPSPATRSTSRPSTTGRPSTAAPSSSRRPSAELLVAFRSHNRRQNQRLAGILHPRRPLAETIDNPSLQALLAGLARSHASSHALVLN